MIITIAEIVGALRRQKKTCVITFTLENDKRLFRVFVRGGDICSLSLGALRDAECLPSLNNLRFKQYTFIPETDDRMPTGGLNREEVFKRMSECHNTVCGGTDNVFGSTVRVDPVDPRALTDIEEAITSLAGPVAGLLLQECCNSMGYQRGGSLSPGALRRLTQLLAEELPSSDRPAFLSRFRTNNA